jgi:hypothetical protein
LPANSFYGKIALLVMSGNEGYVVKDAGEAMTALGGLFDGLGDTMAGDWNARLGAGSTRHLSTPAQIPLFGGEFQTVKALSVGVHLAEIASEAEANGVFCARLVSPTGQQYGVYIGATPKDIEKFWPQGVPPVVGTSDAFLLTAYSVDDRGNGQLLFGGFLGSGDLGSGAIANGQPLPTIGRMAPPPGAVVTNTMFFRPGQPSTPIA